MIKLVYKTIDGILFEIYIILCLPNDFDQSIIINLYVEKQLFQHTKSRGIKSIFNFYMT